MSGLLALPPWGWAAEPQAARMLDLPAGTLDEALKRLALQEGLQVLYAPSVVRGRQARALHGRMDVEQALRHLLEGSGLRAIRSAPGTYVLREVAQAPAPAPAAAREPDPPPRQRTVDMARLEVIGSRIPRVDIDAVTTSPMTLIGRDEIEASGYQTLFELLRFQPGMTGHHPVAVAADGGPNFQQPFNIAATTSLNALGPRATLFLVDGRRVANYGLTSSELGGLTDLDVIPLSMVERVEILRGGASAIYGADAMAGVVNIILRKQQDGGELIVRHGQSGEGDAQEQRVSLSHGFATPRGGNGLVALDWFDRDALAGDSRDWHTYDHSRHGLPDWRIPLGYRDANLRLVRLQCGNAPPAIAATCLFDPARYISLQPESRRTSVYGALAEPLWEGTTFELDLRYSEARQALQNPPFRARVNLPAGHPDSLPGGSLDYAYFEVGPVRNRNRNHSFDGTASVTGWLGDWTWEAALSHHANVVESRIDGLVSTRGVEQSVFVDRYRFDGTPNPASLLGMVSPTFALDGRAQVAQVSLGFEGPLFSLPGGPARLATGVEGTRNRLVHEPDARLQQDDLALGTPKRALDSRRDGGAVYAEMVLPLRKGLEAELAVRYDRQQGYDSRYSPRFGLKWSPWQSLTLRATAATGYRAPSLFELRRPNVFESQTFVRKVPVVGDCAVELEISRDLAYCLVDVGAFENPDLEPETSRSHTLGFVWAPSADFSLSFDHFRIRRDNEILAGNAFDDVDAFPDSLRRDALGRLVAIDSYFENTGRTDVRGWEAEMRTQLDAGDAGRFSLLVSAHHTSSIERQSWPSAPRVDSAGYDAPNTQLLASVQWLKGHWTSTLGLRARGPFHVTGGDSALACPGYNGNRCETPGRGVVDFDLAYTGFPNLRLSLNVRDLADRDPVNYDTRQDGYNVAFDDPRGRFFLLSARYRF
ncbi:TonB-dependent receptor [Marilutibacter aestuarii]|nr:TonB-dependent receptor [Lysobacter aestuarii]